MNQTVTTMIPLNKLRKDKVNVRTSKATKEADEELIASISSVGLLENLCVAPRDRDLYGVIAGGRRFQALCALHKRGDLPKDHPVPCLVIDDDAATEVSLAENSARVAMHPADQAVAYESLAAKGATNEDIASRFGVTVRTVQKWRRVGKLPKTILDDYRKGDIGQEAVVALATTEDSKMAGRVYRELKKGGNVAPWVIKRTLDEKAASSTGRLAVFVGLEAYEAAGGRYEETLFADDEDERRLLDPDLLVKLATDKLQAEADNDADENPWKWRAVALDFGWQEEQTFQKAHAEGDAMNDEETAAWNKLQEEIETISGQTETGEIAEDEAWEQIVPLEQEQARIEREADSRKSWQDGLPELAGCVFSIDQSGSLRIVRGLVESGDLKAYRKLTKATGGSESAPGKPKKAPGAYAESVRDDLRLIRGSALRHALAENPNLAMDVLAFHMARNGAFAPVYAYGHNWNDAHSLTVRSPHHERRGSKKLAELDDVREAADTNPVPETQPEWFEEEDQQKAWQAFVNLSGITRESILAHCIAATVEPYLADDEAVCSPLEHAASELKVDFPDRVRALGIEWSAEVFWNRLTKAQILREGEQWLGKEWVEQHSAMKKGDLAAAAAEAIAKVPEFTPQGFTTKEDG